MKVSAKQITIIISVVLFVLLCFCLKYMFLCDFFYKDNEALDKNVNNEIEQLVLNTIAKNKRDCALWWNSPLISILILCFIMFDRCFFCIAAVFFRTFLWKLSKNCLNCQIRKQMQFLQPAFLWFPINFLSIPNACQ